MKVYRKAVGRFEVAHMEDGEMFICIGHNPQLWVDRVRLSRWNEREYAVHTGNRENDWFTGAYYPDWDQAKKEFDRRLEGLYLNVASNQIDR